MSALPLRGSPSTKSPGRAQGLWSWTAPLRPLRRRYERLAAAAYRCAGLSVASSIFLFMRFAGRSLDGKHVLLALAPLLLAAPLFLLGRRAAREAERVDEELSSLEAEAIRALDERG